jgi:outer membrane receptor for ferrienterochelin and colicins
VARGFRGPSFKELLWDFPNPFAGYAIKGNPALRPERSWQMSLGGAWSPARGLVADAEVYRNELKDLIELTSLGNDSTTNLQIFSPRNVSRARTEGVELSLRWNGATWYGGAEYSHLNARDLDTGATLDRRAAESARLRMGGAIPRVDRLRADATLSYTGSAPYTAPDGTTARQAAFLSGNLQLQYQFPGRVGLSVGGDNLFNARPAGAIGVTGRRVYVGLSGAWRP